MFTKLLKPIFSHLRSKGFKSNVYLDDCLLFGKSYNECIKNLKYTIHLLSHLGFIINYEKSYLIPKTSCQYLGFIIDSVRFSTELTEKRKLCIKEKINSFKVHKFYKIREYAHLQGLLVSAFPGVDYGMLYTKNFEIDKSNILRKNNKDDHEPKNDHITSNNK